MAVLFLASDDASYVTFIAINLRIRQCGSNHCANLDLSYHLRSSFLAFSNAKGHVLSRATVQPDWTINHHNPTEQLLRLMALRRKVPGTSRGTVAAVRITSMTRSGWLEHRHVAAVELIRGCAHALGHGALQIGMQGAVFFPGDVPAWLRLPRGSPDFRLEQVGFGDPLSRPNEASAPAPKDLRRNT